jgi:hypothetical protein
MPRMEAMAESVRHDLVGHDALMPSMGKMEDAFSASNRFKQGCISHCFSWPTGMTRCVLPRQDGFVMSGGPTPAMS